MALGDGIRRNIASVDPTERAMLRAAILEMHKRYYPGSKTDAIPGGVSWWFKQDEIHQATHVHRGPEFLPWHRELTNRFEQLLRQINPQLSLHYWNFEQDPTNITDGNLGSGTIGTLNLFDSSFFGSAVTNPGDHADPDVIGDNVDAGDPWLAANFYDPLAGQPHIPGQPDHPPFRGAFDGDPNGTNNPVDLPRHMARTKPAGQGAFSPTGQADGIVNNVLNVTYPAFRVALEILHNSAHGYLANVSQHVAFRDPLVFLLHSNVDRIYAKWQTDPAHPERLDPIAVYGVEPGQASNGDVSVPGGGVQNLNHNVEPWSTGAGAFHALRPWEPTFENQGVPHNYRDLTVVAPPCYDTNASMVSIVQVLNVGTPPVINFNDVPTGETSVRAAVFRIYNCNDTTVRVKGPGPSAPFSVLQPSTGSVTLHHGAHLFQDVRIWLAFTAGPAGVPVPDSTVTFECPENGKEFTFILKANAINRPKVAVMLALDQSGSMASAAGTSGATRIDVLKDAARKFMELIQQDNGVGLIRFDHNAYPVNDPVYPGLGVTKILSNNMFDPGRVAAINAVNNHHTNPAGNTSIGDGVDMVRQVLNAVPPGDYDQKAMIVLTDGLENDPLWIADVAGSIDSRTFAIGLGNETQVNTVALTALTHGTGGYLRLTGLLSSSIDDYFRLSKYFLQILAGITNTDIILDPSGFIAPGAKVRIEFSVTEADIDCTLLMMTDLNVVDLMLEAPDGTVITPAMAPGLGMTYGVGEQTKNYRFTLPVAIGTGQRAGVWHAVMVVNHDQFKRKLSWLRERNDPRFPSFSTHGARYDLVVNTYSNLRMGVRFEQSNYEPGARLTFQAVLTEYDLPVEKRARVHIELTRPGASVVNVPMTETEPGTFEAFTTATFSGIYFARILAKGVTLRGAKFTREHLASMAVWKGGDNPRQPPRDPRNNR